MSGSGGQGSGASVEDVVASSVLGAVAASLSVAAGVPTAYSISLVVVSTSTAVGAGWSVATSLKTAGVGGSSGVGTESGMVDTTAVSIEVAAGSEVSICLAEGGGGSVIGGSACVGDEAVS